MAWRVDLYPSKARTKYEYGPKGPEMMGKISVSDPRLTPDQVAPRVIISGKISQTALFVMGAGGSWIVSERFKDIVENLEPGIHNWLPTDLVNVDGNRVPEPHYFLQVGQTLDTVIFERTAFNSGVSATGEHYVTFPKTNHLMTLDRVKIAGKHLWKEKYAGYQDTFFSNELIKTLKKLRLGRGFQLFDCNEETAS